MMPHAFHERAATHSRSPGAINARLATLDNVISYKSAGERQATHRCSSVGYSGQRTSGKRAASTRRGLPTKVIPGKPQANHRWLSVAELDSHSACCGPGSGEGVTGGGDEGSSSLWSRSAAIATAAMTAPSVQSFPSDQLSQQYLLVSIFPLEQSVPTASRHPPSRHTGKILPLIRCFVKPSACV
jgi:hypothetical protein